MAVDFFEFIFAGVTALAIKVVPEIVSHAVGVIKRELNSIFPGISRTYSQARKTVDITAEELSDIDIEITRRGESIRQSENATDRQKIEELEITRQEIYKEYLAAQGESAQQEVNESPQKFQESKLELGYENKLLYHTGLITLGKKCPDCGRAMRLQHKSIDNPSYNDFFWQCVGYYEGNKCKTFPFKSNDLNLFHKKDIDEINMRNDDLNTIAKDEEKDIENKLNTQLGKVDNDILCPVHLVPMKHKKKYNSENLPYLDRHYLRCPNPNCSQTTKLKSYAQVSAYLRRKEGKGILGNT